MTEQSTQSALISSAYSQALEVIESVEPRIAAATRQELVDQRGSLKLIASENYASPAVLLTMGTWFSDKYAEGTVGHRFYAGCQNVDTVEALAAEHARELFGAPYAYAQPHSGIDANLVAYWSILAHRVEGPWLEKLGAKNVNELSDADWETLRGELGNQRLLGMSLDAGGHLTHGFRPNISGKMFHQQQYGTDPETGLLDYDVVLAKAREFRPLVLVAGYSAYPRRINFAKMREIADEVGATLFVDMAHFAGLVAGKVFTGDEDPVPFAHITTTTTHKSLRGPRGGLVLAQEEYAASVDRGCPLVLGGPLSHVMAGEGGRARRGPQDSFQTYAQAIADNAKSLADGFLTRGATLVTGGTDNHIVLLDVTAFGLTGRQAESALLDAGVVTNRNSVPADPNGAWYTSGVRLGTPALTTRGFGHDEFDRVAELIVDVLKQHPAGPDQGGRPVEGGVHPRRRRRRPHPRRVGRDARQASALPRPRAQPDQPAVLHLRTPTATAVAGCVGPADVGEVLEVATRGDARGADRSATSVAEHGARRSCATTLVTCASVSLLSPLGSGDRSPLAQGVEHPVDVVLRHVGGSGLQLAPVRGVLLELRPERRERERLDQVEHDTLSDGLAHDDRVAGGGHCDHVGVAAGGPDPLQQLQPVAVREVHVQQDQVGLAAVPQLP